MSELQKSRRYKIAHIQPKVIHDIVKASVNQAEYLNLPLSELPPDCEFSEAWYSYESKSFCVRAYHESFAEVPVGEYPPNTTALGDIFVLTYRLDESGPDEDPAPEN